MAKELTVNSHVSLLLVRFNRISIFSISQILVKLDKFFLVCKISYTSLNHSFCVVTFKTSLHLQVTTQKSLLAVKVEVGELFLVPWDNNVHVI